MEKSTKVNILELAKMQSVLFALIGIIFGIIYSFGGLIIDSLVSLEIINSNETAGLSYGTILAFGALVGMPLIASVIGFILGIIEALLFNIFMPLFGGINNNLFR